MDVSRRTEIEDRFLKDMRKLNTRQREELILLLGNPPDPRNVPSSFWRRVEEEHRNMLVLMLLMLSTESGMKFGLGEIPARAKATGWANLQASKVARKYTENSQARLMTGLDKIYRNRLEKFGDGFTPSGRNRVAPTQKDVRELVTDIFGETRRFDTISTEGTRAITHGTETAAVQVGFAHEKDRWKIRPWRTSTGTCKRCKRLDGKLRSQWGVIDPDAVNGPPIHPHCACIIVYHLIETGQVSPSSVPEIPATFGTQLTP
ncbi:hypothetical protein KOR42_22940 [Thalassoglobus neptunius]|uniref:Phage Mu protein F like protein n=1 Tax=Thalassoglobus neptunius TaxID=1938619 RepID=A0A5C5X713_9PLAN|nr:hypothetical protein [Thalassoglobus neptunius]TWT58907.1 hypothetical protein KOR42_22940 [Thalassoglobus neptunius]